MESVTDWLTLWKELSQLQTRSFERERMEKAEDFWKENARKFDKEAKLRWAVRDSSRDFLVRKLKGHPGSTLLDIGAGTGNWSLLAARHAGSVSALDPSPAMRDILREKIKREQVKNIRILDGAWPGYAGEAGVHDYVLASHSMYGVEDFHAFVTQMNRTARKGCIMVLRALFANTPMAVACEQVLGQPYYCPSFQVAYNALLAMDIYPDVVMESRGGWKAWSHDTLDQALGDVKNRLNLWEENSHDAFLMKTLKTHLRKEDGKWRWPPGSRSALIHWRPL